MARRSLKDVVPLASAGIGITNYYKTFRGCVSPRMSRVRDREHIPISLEKRVNHCVATWGHSWNCKIFSVMQYFWSCCNTMQLSAQYWLEISRWRIYYFRNSLVVVLSNWAIVNRKLLTIIPHTKVLYNENLDHQYFRNSLLKLCTQENCKWDWEERLFY